MISRMKATAIHTQLTFIAILASTIGFAPSLWAGPVVQPPAEQYNFYLFGFGGANWLEDADGSFNGTSVDLNSDTGWTGGAGFGWRSDFLGGTRAEIEGAYRSNQLDEARFDGLSIGLGDGDNAEINSTSIMLNLVKEFPLFNGGLVAYAGGGAGWSSVQARVNFAGDDFEDSSEVFIWQVIAGLELPITPRFGLYTEYRLTPFTDFTWQADTAIGDVDLGFDQLYNHGVVGGFRFYF